MAQQALGIVQTESKLNVALLSKGYKQFVLKSSETYDLETDKSDLDARKDEILQKLNVFSMVNKVGNARLSIGLNRNDYLWSIVEMPPVSSEDVRQILGFELESHLPVDQDAVAYDACLMESIAGVTSRVALAACDSKLVDHGQAIAAKSGLDLDAITTTTYSVINVINANWKPVTDAKHTVFLLCSEDGYEVVVTKDGKHVASRMVEFSSPWHIKDDLDRDTETTDKDITGIILQNIQLTLLMANLSSGLDSIEELTCLGRCDETVLKEMKDRLPATVFSAVEIENLIDQNTSYDQIAAISLAMEQLGDGECLNLLPPELRPVRRDIGKILISVGAGVLAAGMVLVGANNFWQTDLALAATNARIASLETKVNQITDINQRFSATQEAKSFFLSRSADYPSHLEVLMEVTRLLPSEDTETTKKVWLENYEVEEHQLKIRGDSDSPEGLLTSLEESPYFEGVKFDGTVSGTRFTIKANISKLSDLEDSEFSGDGTGDGETEANGNAGENGKANKKPTATPLKDNGDKEEDAGGDVSEVDETEEESPVRGPAFPRTRPGEEQEDNNQDAAAVPDDSPPADDKEEMDESRRDEDMEAMKENLFKFIQERKEAGDLDERPDRDREPQDPDEAAANFLEFLKAAADSGEGEDN